MTNWYNSVALPNFLDSGTFGVFRVEEAESFESSRSKTRDYII